MATPRELPDVLPVLPMRDRVVLPLEVVAAAVRDEGAQGTVHEAMRSNRLLALVATRSASDPATTGLREVGTVATIQRLERTDDGALRLLVHAQQRISVGEPVQTQPSLIVRVRPKPEVLEPGGPELEALAHAVRNLFLELHSDAPAAMTAVSRDLGRDPAQLVYVVASNLAISADERLAILEMDPLLAKLRHVLDLLQHERTVRDLGRSIDEQTREQLTKEQREALLRQQLRTIERELGVGGGPAELAQQLREQATQAQLPPEAAREVEREIARLERLPESSPEHGMLRTYIEWMVSLPWSRTTSAPIDLERARQALDEDHDDLIKVKERILEHLAVKKLRHERGVDIGLTGAGEARHAGVAGPLPPPPEDRGRREPILCFVGPPGVGKTSLGESIARAMQRRFLRISLGGIHDESEIRGHRRTYIGSLPGRIVQALRRAGVADPVFMLDEVDKLGVGFHGDPAAALLEVLDPAQNRTFVDNYLGVPFDLSRVFFICTANAIDPIPAPLQDRMEIIQLSGYSEEEKLRIGRRHLLPRLIGAHGLKPEEVAIDDAAIARLIREYTREAGVRQLERVLSEVLRKVARRIGEGAQTPVQVHADDVRALIGPPRVHRDPAEQIDRPGIALGLAWTPVGGEVLFVEAAAAPERGGKLLLTGMLGEVMRESAETALSYLLSNAIAFGVPPDIFHGKTVHVHVPAGAIPKDGPSAGVAILTALASLATGRTQRPRVAMTGEITLRGKVLPVGGIPEKVLAAYRVGVHTVILPRANADALEDVPQEVRDKLRFEWVDSADQVLRIALPEPGAVAEPPVPPS